MSMPSDSGASTTRPTPAPDPEVKGFLALLAARRAPRTVDAYRRDLADLAGYLGRSPADANTDDLQAWLADLRGRGQASSSIARRAAAARSFYNHLVLLGRREDNPAAELDLPRRRTRLPRTLSPGEVERLIQAANGTTPRVLRRIGGGSAPRPSRPAPPVREEVAGTVLPPDPRYSLAELDDDALCRLWRYTYWQLDLQTTEAGVLELVALRQACLDELERRDPSALRAWLFSGERASGGAERFWPHGGDPGSSDAA